MSVPTKFLQKLSNGIEKSKVVIIQESLECRGDKLFQSIIKSWSSIPGSKNYLLLLQGCQKDYEHHKVTVVDVLGQFSDITKEQNYTDEIKKQLTSLVGGKLFIDSIDPLIFGGEENGILELFRLLSNKFDSIVTLTNSCVANEPIEHKLKRLSSTWIQINPLTSNNHTFMVKIINKKRHRRVDFVLESYEENVSIDSSNLTITTFEAIRHNSAPSNVSSGGILPDVTFNLNLRDDEREAKESLVLPYIKNRMSNTKTTASDSKVYYYPDQNDDVDEDDPDDDLGI